jgi:hypothetical protein
MASMRWLYTVSITLLCACGPAPDPEDPCGLGLELPELQEGEARYVRDFEPVNVTTGEGYQLSFPNDIVINSIVMNFKLDHEGRLVEDLVDTGKYPICVPLDSRDDGSGWAMVEDGGSSFGTDASHKGTLAVLAKEGSALIGRFEFDAMENNGTRVTEIDEGVFKLLPR